MEDFTECVADVLDEQHRKVKAQEKDSFNGLTLSFEQFFTLIQDLEDVAEENELNSEIDDDDDDDDDDELAEIDEAEEEEMLHDLYDSLLSSRNKSGRLSVKLFKKWDDVQVSLSLSLRLMEV